MRTRAAVIVATLLAVIAVIVVAPTGASAAPGGTLALTLSQSTTTLEPGQTGTYTLQAGCSGLNVDCQDAVATITLPMFLDVDAASLPQVPNSYSTAYDPATGHLTVTFLQPLSGGTTGIAAGTNVSVTLHATLPANTTEPDATPYSIGATGTSTGRPPVTSNTLNGTVSIPPVVGVTGTKAFAPTSGIAQSGAATTVTISATNTSSSTAVVDQLTAEDTIANSAQFWNAFDFTGFGAVTFPPGADQVEVDVCTTVATCTSGTYVNGSAAATPALPGTVTAADVQGLRFRFSNSGGTALGSGAPAGSVPFTAALRNADRTTGDPITPTGDQSVQNCVAISETDPAATPATATDTPCSTYTIHSNTPTQAAAKTFFPDAAGNLATSNGFAVAGHASPVTALIRSTNTSPFAVKTMTLTEPDPAGTSPNLLTNDLTTGSVRVAYPSGATSAVLTVTCSDATTPSQPVTDGQTVTALCTSPAVVTRVQVVFTGDDGSGNGTITGTTAGIIAVHGTLNSSVTAGNLQNCAASEVTVDGTPATAADAAPCGTLTVQTPSNAVGVMKTGTSTHLVPGQPFTYTVTAKNNGNLDSTNVRLSDPSDPPPSTGNPFDDLQLQSATVTPSSAEIDIWDATVPGWVALATASPGQIAATTAISAVPTAGTLVPGASVRLNYTVMLRGTPADGTAISNCGLSNWLDLDGSTTDTSATTPNSCLTATVHTGAATGSVSKTMSPAAIARPLDGVTPAQVTVTLKAANTGNVPMQSLVVEDKDPSYFDTVDFQGLGAVTFPQGANQVRADACTSVTDCANDVWIDGPVTATTTPALDSSVVNSTVLGVRFTFSNSTAGPTDYDLVACADPNAPTTTCQAAGHAGTAAFRVSPRVAPRSAPSTPIVYPATFSDTSAGTAVGEGSVTPLTLDPAAATAHVDVNLGTTNLQPAKTFTPAHIPLGGVSTVALKVTNNGTGAISDVVLSDPLPVGLLFTGVAPTVTPPTGGANLSADGSPYVVSYVVPAGTPAPPAPIYTPQHDTRDPQLNVSQVDFEFKNWTFLPGTQVIVSFQVTLAPGTVTGTSVNNQLTVTTPGLTAQQAPLSCTGTCTPSAALLSDGGDAFTAQKWVHGDDTLGFYNTTTDTYVTPGDSSCPALTQSSVIYTRTPCIALVLPGQNFQYLMVVRNVGADAASTVNMVDVLPHQGDTGVLLTGEQRGTEWNNRPHLTAAPSVVGDTNVNAGELDFGYTGADQPDICTNDLADPPTTPCAAGDWDPAFSTDATAFRAIAQFPTGSHLPAGGAVELLVPMQAPVDLAAPDSLPIAWNSFAHTDFVDGTGQLLPQEPPQVGVGMPFGNLVVSKTIAAPAPPAGTTVGPFTANYSCSVTPAGGSAVVVRSGSGSFNVGSPFTVSSIPAGASCQVWETDTGGATSDHPVGDPATVAIPIGATVSTPTSVTVVLTNTFPAAPPTGGTTPTKPTTPAHGATTPGDPNGPGAAGPGSSSPAAGAAGSGSPSGASASDGSALASTGSDVRVQLLLGSVVLAAGLALVVLARRRTRRQH
jgi:uncharacterized repeat protein (TIGR01451 family)